MHWSVATCCLAFRVNKVIWYRPETHSHNNHHVQTVHAKSNQGQALTSNQIPPHPVVFSDNILNRLRSLIFLNSRIADNLFGSCQKADAQEEAYRYHLDRGTLHVLEGQITRLVEQGFTWTSLYTQCVVGNIMLAFRLGVQPDR